MGCVLRGRSKALGVEGHLRQVGIQGYGRLPYGYPMGYHVDTLWGTLWRPRNPRGYPQNPWILERDSRETQERLKRDSRETQERLKTVSRQSPQLPKHGSQRARRVRWVRNHLTGIAAAATTRSERGRPFSPTQECEQGEPFDVEGHRREGWDIQRHVIPHVTWHAKHAKHGKHCQAWQSSWNQVSNHEVMIPSHHHTSQSGPAGPAGPSTLTILLITTLSEQLWRAVNSSNKAVSSSQELSERVQTAPDGAVCTEEWRLPCHSPFFPCWVHGRLDSLLLFSLHASWKETA